MSEVHKTPWMFFSKRETRHLKNEDIEDLPVREVLRDGTPGKCYGTCQLGECFDTPKESTR